VGILLVLIAKTYIGEELKIGFNFILGVIYKTYIGKVSFDFIGLIGHAMKRILDEVYITNLT
jgi:hypothetical protein